MQAYARGLHQRQEMQIVGQNVRRRSLENAMALLKPNHSPTLSDKKDAHLLEDKNKILGPSTTKDNISASSIVEDSNKAANRSPKKLDEPSNIDSHHSNNESTDHGNATKSSLDPDDSLYQSPFQRRTCRYTCSIWNLECKILAKSASAICVALLWSACITSLMRSILASFVDHEEFASHCLAFILVSVVILCALPCVLFKYINIKQYWAAMLIVEIFGHVWGFRVKDIITYAAYELHHLATVYSADNMAVSTESFCDVVDPTLYLFDIMTDISYESRDFGFLGFNLDWGFYTFQRDVFDGYYDDVHSSSHTTVPTSDGDARFLSEEQHFVSPAPFSGSRIDLHADDEHEVGPGRLCSFTYRTASPMKGYRVEKNPRKEYWIEMG